MTSRHARAPITLVALLAVLAFAVVACGGSDDAGGPGGGGKDGGTPEVVRAGDPISVEVGQEFVVELPATPSTGYEWIPEANPLVTLRSSRQVAGGSGRAGAPGTQRLTFAATDGGSSTLVLNYARSFDPPGTAPAKTESFPLGVLGGPVDVGDAVTEGGSVTTAVGDQFTVALPGNPSTGYTWTAVTDPRLTYVSTVNVSGSSTLPGAPVTQVLTFRAVATGTTTLTLNYARSFDPPGTPPAKTATFPVTVR